MILCLLRACSDAMVRAGTTQHPVTLPREVAVQLRTSQHSCDSSFLKYASEQRTLNPRVRGSSPWRRTRKVFTFDLRLSSRLGLTFRALGVGPGWSWVAGWLPGWRGCSGQQVV